MAPENRLLSQKETCFFPTMHFCRCFFSLLVSGRVIDWKQIPTGWWFQICFIFIPTWGFMIQFDWRAYFSDGSVQPRFWDYVASLTVEQRSQLLQWITGYRRIPPGEHTKNGSGWGKWWFLQLKYFLGGWFLVIFLFYPVLVFTCGLY